MKTLYHLAIICFLFVVLASCTSTSRPTPVVIPTDLAFSTSLVKVLSRSGLNIVSVQYSTYVAIFPSTDQAVWIETHQGIVEAVFFADPTEVEQIHITEQPGKIEGQYLYTIQAPPPTLLHDQILDLAFPLYFTAKNEMLMITRSEELDKTLKEIFSGP